MTEPLPCPLCDIYLQNPFVMEHTGDGYRGYCPHCGTSGPISSTHDQAVANWNIMVKNHIIFLKKSLARMGIY